jgi:hypothetical protein
MIKLLVGVGRVKRLIRFFGAIRFQVGFIISKALLRDPSTTIRTIRGSFCSDDLLGMTRRSSHRAWGCNDRSARPIPGCE